MQITDDHRRITWKMLRRVAALFHGKLPPWAILVLVLFGGGGVFYAGYDFLRRQPAKTRSVYDGAPALPVEMEASFFPNYATTMPAGVIVEVVDTGTATLPNLKLTLDSGNARLESCEVRTVDKLVAEPVKTETGNFIVTMAQLLPNERIQIYCLADNPQKISITLNATDSEGKTLGSATDTFARSTEVQGSSLRSFLTIVVDVILAAAGLSLIYLLFGFVGRLAAWLGLYPEEKKSN
jgi:hypothetical protein